MHLPNGFFGTRADLLMDIVLVTIVLTPFILYYSFHLARQKRFLAHRNLNAGLIAFLWVAVVLFELDIRMSGGTAAFIRDSRFASSQYLRWFFFFHVAIAILTFTNWATLALKSWGQFASQSGLPGALSGEHKAHGKLIYLGVIVTAVSGVVLYVFCFAI